MHAYRYPRVWLILSCLKPWTLQLVTRMTSFGCINEYQAEDEAIGAYLERVEFFQANDIMEGKKVAVFLSVIGGKAYTLLCNLLSLLKPQEKSFEALAEELKKHFKPKKVVIAERFRFHRRD